MPFTVPDACQNAGDDAALYCHAALPDKRYLQQMMLVIIPVEKEYIPEASADQTGKAAVNTNVQYMLLPAAILFGQKVSNTSC